MSDIRNNGKPFSCDSDFVISYTKEHGYNAITLGTRDIIGNCYFDEDTAERYVKEIESILGR